MIPKVEHEQMHGDERDREAGLRAELHHHRRHQVATRM
jgi:hypothetical protein